MGRKAQIQTVKGLMIVEFYDEDAPKRFKILLIYQKKDFMMV